MTTAWQVVTVCHSTELERLQGRSVPGYLIYKENKRVLHTVLTVMVDLACQTLGSSNMEKSGGWRRCKELNNLVYS